MKDGHQVNYFEFEFLFTKVEILQFKQTFRNP